MENKFTFKVDNKKNDIVDIDILGYITDEKWVSEDTTPSWFKHELDKAANAKTINLNVNSGGGSVFAGLAINNMINSTKATVNTKILGLAASTASWMIMPSDSISMASNAWIMMHLPQIIAAGNKNDLKKIIDMLDRIEDSIAMSYIRNESKVTKEQIKAMINGAEEVWLKAEDALKLGFIDKIDGNVPVKNSADSIIINGIAHDKGIFKSLPRDQAPDLSKYLDIVNNNYQRLINLKKGTQYV